MRGIVALTLSSFFLVLGCTARSYGVRGPDSRNWWFAVECSDKGACYREAGRRCNFGYEIADSGTTSSTVVNTRGGYAGTWANGTMLIRCKEKFEVTAPQAPAARAAASSAAPASGEKRQVDADLAAIRRAPAVPEVGATVAEAQVLCRQNRGDFVDRSGKIGCSVGGVTTFACAAGADRRTERCDGYFEDGDFAARRRALEAELGAPARESVSADGFRVFEWSTPTETVTITMYARGVRITRARRTADATIIPDPPSAPSSSNQP